MHIDEHYRSPKYDGFETDPLILEAIEQTFSGVLFDNESEAHEVWANGYTVLHDTYSVNTEISRYLRHMGVDDGTILNWGVDKLTVDSNF